MYGCMSLWSFVLGVLLYEYEYYGRKERNLFLMLPFIFASHITFSGAYLLTLSIIVSVIVLDIIEQKAFYRVMHKHAKWVMAILGISVVTVLPYYPFHFSNLFDHASWIPSPTLIKAIRIFPYETLGLETHGFISICIITLGVLLTINRRNFLLPLLIIFLVPFFTFIFSIIYS